MPNRLQWWRDRSRDPRFMLVLAALITLATSLALYITIKVVSSSGAASGLPLVY